MFVRFPSFTVVSHKPGEPRFQLPEKKAPVPIVWSGLFQAESQGVAVLEGGMVLLKTQLPGTPGDRLAEPALQIAVEAKRPRQPNRDTGFSSAGPATGAQGACRAAQSVRVTGWEVATALLFSIPTTPALSLSARPALPGTPGAPAWTTANQ